MNDLTPTLTESQKLNLNIISLNTAVNNLQDTVETHDKVLIRGNGELPLREQVRNHDAIIKEWKTWIKFFIGLMITQAVAVLGGIIVAYIKFLPILEKLAKYP